MATPNVAALPAAPIKNIGLTPGKVLSKAATITMIVLAALMMSGHLSISQASIGMLACGGFKTIRLMYKYADKQETKKSVTMKLVFLITPALLMGVLGLSYSGLSVKTLGWIYFGPLLTKVTCQFLNLSGLKYQASQAKDRLNNELIEGPLSAELLQLQILYPEAGLYTRNEYVNDITNLFYSFGETLGDDDYNNLFIFFWGTVNAGQVKGVTLNEGYRGLIENLNNDPVMKANLQTFFNEKSLPLFSQVVNCWAKMVAWEKAKAELCPTCSSAQPAGNV
jgi:hypothetical protein